LDFFDKNGEGSVPPVEPSADMRAGAKAMYEMYLSYKNAGFSAVEALQLTSAFLTESLRNVKE
jgi:hypothetical protein